MVAVIAHSGKTFGGLGELRRVLEDAGFPRPLWYEVAKSRQAPDCARLAREDGAGCSRLVWSPRRAEPSGRRPSGGSCWAARSTRPSS